MQNRDNVLIVSSDLSHFHNLQEPKTLDSHCLRGIAKLDYSELSNGCEACGLLGIQALVIAAKQLKLSSKLFDYRTSADTNGDNSSVVEYMSAVLY